MMPSTLLQTLQCIIYNVNADSAIRFVETMLGFRFKLDSLHTHTSLMQYSFQIQCYRGNDLLSTAVTTDVLILYLLKCLH